MPTFIAPAADGVDGVDGVDAIPPSTPGAEESEEIPLMLLAGNPMQELHAALEAVTAHYRVTMQHMDAMFARVAEVVEKSAQHNEHATYQLAGALEALAQQGLQTQAPNEATLHFCTTEGYPASLTLRRREAADLMSALSKASTWLLSKGYSTPGQEAR